MDSKSTQKIYKTMVDSFIKEDPDYNHLDWLYQIMSVHEKQMSGEHIPDDYPLELETVALTLVENILINVGASSRDLQEVVYKTILKLEKAAA